MRSPFQWWRDRQEARARARIDAFVPPLAANSRQLAASGGARWGEAANDVVAATIATFLTGKGVVCT